MSDDKNYDSTILCPDSPAGSQALHERIQDGWDVVCQWREETFGGGKTSYINHIVLRREAPSWATAQNVDADDGRAIPPKQVREVLSDALKELTSGNHVDRALRAQSVIEGALSQLGEIHE